MASSSDPLLGSQEEDTKVSENRMDFTLGSKVFCRENQVNTLISLFGQKSHMTTGSLFIYGHTSTGKTYTLQTLLARQKLPHIFINCIECVSSRFLFEHILNNLPSSSETENVEDAMDVDGEEVEEYVSCDDMSEFVRLVTKSVSSREYLSSQTLYLVFDKAERLRDGSQTLLPALLRLQELTKLNVCTIFVSEIVWEKFRFGTGFCEPLCLHFPDYSRQELQDIMSIDCPRSCDQGLYSLYVSIVLSVFHMVCRDLREVRHLARLNLPYFLEPIQSGDATSADTRKLWRNIEPHLKKALQSVYLREVSSRQWEKIQQDYLDDPDAEDVKVLPPRSHIELPFYSKFLLIAAYLASYNPSKYDKRLFAKHAGKISRRQKLDKKKERASNHLLGPKMFQVDRLMAIFYSIVEGKVIPSALISVQISSLVSLHLLSQIGGDDRISTPKYKCRVSLDFIRSIARTVQFDVMKYLYDFL